MRCRTVQRQLPRAACEDVRRGASSAALRSWRALVRGDMGCLPVVTHRVGPPSVTPRHDPRTRGRSGAGNRRLCSMRACPLPLRPTTGSRRPWPPGSWAWGSRWSGSWSSSPPWSRPSLALSIWVVVGVAVVGVAAVAAAGWWATRRAVVVHLDDAGYRVRFVRGVGAPAARWPDVRDAGPQFVAGSACVVLRLRDGRTTTIPVEVAGRRPGGVRPRRPRPARRAGADWAARPPA